MLKDLLPILVVVITACLGLFTYEWNERVKRKSALVERRQALYEALIRNLVELLTARTGMERSKLITEIEKGWLFASDEVLHAAYNYLGIYNNLCCSTPEGKVLPLDDVLSRVRSDNKVRKELGESISAIFLAMRRDVRPDTKVSASWAKQHIQLYQWGLISDAHGTLHREKKK